MKSKYGLLMVFLLVFPILGSLDVYAQPQFFKPQSLTLTVYADGVVSVEYIVGVDPTFPRVNITLLGKAIENLIVVDENDFPLDFSLVDGELVVDSLGSSLVKIFYSTPDLTNKTGKYWSLIVTTPINTTIILPAEATILSLSQVPIAIRSVNKQTILLMPSGFQEVTYVIGVVGTKEYTYFLIEDVEKTIMEIKKLNINVSKAELKLEEAKKAFNEENYVYAENLAIQAKNLAVQINQTAYQALNLIDEAEKAVEKAQKDGRIVGLDEAKNFLVKAKEMFKAGDYQQAYNFAKTAKEKAENATCPFQLEMVIYGLIIVLIVGFGIWFIFFRKKLKPTYPSKEKRSIDLDRIFKENPQLRSDDKEIVQFLAENMGEAFEAEIREKFKLPKTTIWRSIQRLKKEGIVDIHKVAGQNLVRIKSKYEVKKVKA